MDGWREGGREGCHQLQAGWRQDLFFWGGGGGGWDSHRAEWDHQPPRHTRWRWQRRDDGAAAMGPRRSPAPCGVGWGGGGRAGGGGGGKRGRKMAVSVLQLVELALHGAAFLCGIVCASALTVAQVRGWGGGEVRGGHSGFTPIPVLRLPVSLPPPLEVCAAALGGLRPAPASAGSALTPPPPTPMSPLFVVTGCYGEPGCRQRDGVLGGCRGGG